MKTTKTKSLDDKSPLNWMAFFSLLFAGEMVFSLPFHVARFFRPTLLESFGLSNSELGDTFALYGVTAMICYFPGGVIADYFSARKLLTLSLVATALGGLYFAQFPNGLGLTILFGYWGVTTILLFWSGMIKAIREWGGTDSQGRAFGLLEGGRGMVAAVMSSVAVFVFARWVEVDDASVSQVKGLRAVIYFYTFVTLIAAMLVWVFVAETELQGVVQKRPWAGMQSAMTSKRVWLQAVIIICAYCGFKGADNYGLYAVQVLSMDHVDGAVFTSFAAYLRPIGAIGAGLLADRLGASVVVRWCFVSLAILYALLTVSWSASILFTLATFNLILSFTAVFALRGVYFALVEESKINRKITGTAVGFISLIGFTPDIFFSSISGRVLDAAPGVKGFEYYFMLMMVIAFVGLLASIILNRKNRF